MIKKLLIPFLLFFAVSTNAQLNNSWIDYSKTYYKFKLADDNIFRIPQSAIAAAGLASTNADHFQLWRNGLQVRLYTPITAAPLGASDYIEFYGEMNDGKADKPLYKNPNFQLADRYSLETDTASYFLTVNPASLNLRYESLPNPAPASGVVADAFFYRKIDVFYRKQYCKGFGTDFGEYVYSSTYDNGEGPVSLTVSANPRTLTQSTATPTQYDETFSNLNLFTGPSATAGLSVRTKVFFNTANSNRSLSLKGSNVLINFTLPNPTNTVQSSGLNSLNIIANNLPVSTYMTSPSTFTLGFVLTNNNSPAAAGLPQPPIDNMVIASSSITYPSLFNFNNEKQFAFELGASTTGNFIVIDNFNYGTIAPILYDINNGRRYVGDIVSTPGKVKFVLPASMETTRKFILMNIEAANIKTVSSITSKTFVDYNATANKGDYIIISHPKMFNDGAGVNNVELYRAYRSTANGGGYNAKIADINELTDQFAFGIKSHPAAVRDFVRFMDANYSVKPKSIFIIGRGISYYDKKIQELDTATYPTNAPIIDKLDFIPTFGWPPSDVMLTSNPGTVTPITPVGRLGAINGTEVGYYYQKMLQYEQQQRLQSPTIADKAWLKNTMQIVGGRTPSESATFEYYMDIYKDWIIDTLYGGHVDRFTKTSSSTTQLASNAQISQNFTDGLGIIKYFGHSSASTFEFNLSDPSVYSNTGKYPFFHVSGCTAGNYYNFDPSRLTTLSNLSEKYVLANQKGSIAFLADSHFGLPGYLNYWNDKFHENFCRITYGETVGSQIKQTINTIGGNNLTLDFNTRMHIEEINLHGDPALKLVNFPKPDYVIEPQLLKVSPSIISVSDQSFKVKAIWRNIGKATNDSIRVSIKRTLSNNVVETLIDTMIFATRYMDSLEITVPISPLKDKGNNKICVELDNTNLVDELYETNNKTCTDFFIFEATLSPIFPYNYAIVNTQNITYSASTANPLLPVTSNYIMEIDTTALFNSPFKKAYNRTGLGGLIEFNPTNITFTDSTVYYWRTAVIPLSGNTIWNTASFVYLPTSTPGYNVSHYFQYEKNSYKDVFLDVDRKFKYLPKSYQFSLKTAHYPQNQQTLDYSLVGGGIEQSGFYGPLANNINSIRFYVIDPVTLLPWTNTPNGSGAGQYGSNNPVPINQFGVPGFYQFNVSNAAARQVAKDFLDLIPNGFTIAMANGGAGFNTALPPTWASDPGVNLYQTLKSGLGFTDIDQIVTSLPFAFIGKKGTNVGAEQRVGNAVTDRITILFSLIGKATEGEITSDILGPSKRWNALHWKVFPLESAPNDKTSVQVIGINAISGTEDLLTTVVNALDTTLTWINSTTYPNLKLRLLTKDSATATPSQIKYLTLNGDYYPEGAIAPNLLYSMKDTVDAGEPIQFTLAFKNVSKVNFTDSMKIKITIKDNNNVTTDNLLPKGKILVIGDTLKATFNFQSQNFVGNNTLIADFNPDNDQLEQFHFNNLLYKNFYVRGDETDPLLDVTFDGIHILNKDIVSSKPNILIKLKDENRFLALKDTNLLKIKLKYPGESNYRNIYFNNSILTYTPASTGSTDNTFTINLKPFLSKDGDYELVISGKDVTGNEAGNLNYHSTFTVINKSMISEMLNYPNPFTTSTAFVFTLTGNQIPQNIRIQILTISGKVVKEITKAELGDIHIGRNITEYKWNGNDMFNQPLANGVYLYRVITNLNGKSLEKYKGEGDDTEKYFNKGYGKMYLMR